MRIFLKAMASAVVVSGAIIATGVSAQTYPDHTITLVVPFATGGITTNQSRQVADRISEKLGQPVVVLNQAGASGMIGTDSVIRSKPDGYTILYGTHGTLAANLALYDNLRTNPPEDLRAIHSLFKQPTVLVTGADTPYKTVGDLVKAAKDAPGKINFASAGPATLTHLAGARFQNVTETEMAHIPYNGGAAALSGVMGGDVDVTFAFAESAAPLVKSGRLHALAIVGSNPLDILPGVPTIGDEGYPTAALEGWSGIFAPAGTPDEIVETLAEIVKETTEDLQVLEAMAMIGSIPMNLSGEDYQKFVKEEVKYWKEVVEQSGAKLE